MDRASWAGGLGFMLVFAASSAAAQPAITTPDTSSGPPPGTLVAPPGYEYASRPVVPPAPALDPELASPPPPGRRPRAPSIPGRRSTGEIVELYITAGAFGAWTGAYLPLVTGWATDAAPRDESDFYLVSCLVGAGAFMFLPLGLDQIDGGMPTGVPAAISIGVRYGVALGAGGIGAGGGDVRGDDVAHVLWWSGLGGGLLGAAFGYGLRPHPAQVQFVQVGGLWGAALGTLSAFLFAPMASRDETQIGFGIGLGGMLTGLTVTALMSGLEVNPSARRSWFGSLGLLAGAGAGSALWGLGSIVAAEFDVQVWGGSASLGALGGLILVLAVTNDDHEPATNTPPASPDVSVSVAPTQGGGMFSLDGRF